MEESVFARIIRGEIPSHRVYEDERTFAFLDISPVQPGHTLVIPKRQVEFIWDLSEEDYAAVMAASKLIALHLRKIMAVPYVASKVIGTDVPHAHVHLIPFSRSADLQRKPGSGLESDQGALDALAKTLAF